MRKGYEREQVERILVTLQDAMRALVARVTLTHDNQLSVSQKLIVSTYSGWDMKDVPAAVPMLMRDMAIRHDTSVDEEIAKIVNAFEMTDRLIKQATGFDDDEASENPEPKPARNVKPTKINGKSVATTVLAHIRQSASAKTADDLIVYCGGGEGERDQVLKALRELEANGDVVELPSKPPTYAVGLELDL